MRIEKRESSSVGVDPTLRKMVIEKYGAHREMDDDRFDSQIIRSSCNLTRIFLSEGSSPLLLLFYLFIYHYFSFFFFFL